MLITKKSQLGLKLHDPIIQLATSYGLKNMEWIGETQRNAEIFTINALQTLYASPCKYYYICENVYNLASMINMRNFTGKIFEKMKIGANILLMGKDKAFKYIKTNNMLCGIYFYNSVEFEVLSVPLADDYQIVNTFNPEIVEILKLLIYIELGDIEISFVEAGKTNKKTKEKVVNNSDNNVFIVDSSWNKLIIRTEGFGVRGHFRLQPCGEGFKDRKLIWISDFQKHGYIRRPRGQADINKNAVVIR